MKLVEPYEVINRMDDSNSTSHNGLKTFFTRDAEFMMGVAYLIMAVIGVIGNTFTILVMVFRKRLYNCCTPYLISVAVSDLVMTGVFLPVTGLNAVTGRVYVSKVLCKWLSISFHTVTSSSWIGLAMVSAIRCMGIWTNNKCYLLNYTKTFIAAIWLVPSVSITYFLYSSWGSTEHIRTGYICWYFCGVEEMLHDNPAMANSEIVFWLSSIFSFVPLIVMVISYSMICHKIRTSKTTISSLGGKAFNNHRREVRFTRMIGIIFGSYLLFTFIPAVIVVVRSSFPPILEQNQSNDELSHLADSIISSGDQWMFILFFIPFVTNPFIYVVSNPFYRKTFKEFLQKSMNSKKASRTPKCSIHLEMEDRYN